MRQPDTPPAYCRVHRNGHPLIGMCGRGKCPSWTLQVDEVLLYAATVIGMCCVPEDPPRSLVCAVRACTRTAAGGPGDRPSAPVSQPGTAFTVTGRRPTHHGGGHLPRERCPSVQPGHKQRAGSAGPRLKWRSGAQ
jgi:hypothetical protein